jgi:Undecaprenyl-phosphate glucose phosphotransferase
MTSLPHPLPVGSAIRVERRRLPLSSQVVASLVVLVDSVAILLTAGVAHAVIVGPFDNSLTYYSVAISFVWLTNLILMSFAGLYKFDALLRPVSYVDKIVVVFATTFLFLLAAAFALKVSATFSRIWIGTFAIASCAATFSLRLLVSQLLTRLSHVRAFTREIVVAGTGRQVTQLLDFIARRRPPFVSVRGVFIDAEREPIYGGPYPVLGTLDDLTSYARENSRTIDDVVIAMPWAGDERLLEMLSRLRELAVNTYLASDLIGFRLNFQSPPDHFDALPIFEVEGSPFSGWDGVIKTAEDYLFGAAAALVLMPFLLLIALAIKLDSPGPVLFRQKRLGFLNKEFEIYKFRTMKHETAFAPHTVQATQQDSRVTRVGRILRKTSLDEVPNLINVLNGTMSLVGPRPHAVDHNHLFSEAVSSYFVRHKVKPGITGWAQVNGYRGATDTLEKIEGRTKYDIYYAENWSFGFDLRIMVMTVIVCLTGRNAY